MKNSTVISRHRNLYRELIKYFLGESKNPSRTCERVNRLCEQDSGEGEQLIQDAFVAAKSLGPENIAGMAKVSRKDILSQGWYGKPFNALEDDGEQQDHIMALVSAEGKIFARSHSKAEDR